MLEYAARYADAAGLLFDAPRAGGLPGGTGHDVRLVALSLPCSEAAAAARAVRRARPPATSARRSARVRPWAVDVSSGVEALGADGKADRGSRIAARIAAFIEEVRNADD